MGVPQGVQSGMVIPVTIPTTLPPSNAQNGPINVPSQMAHNGIMSPMGSPPSSSYQLHHPQQCYENGLYPTPSTHAQTHHQTTILHQHEKEFLKQQKNSSDSLPITWAAKVGGTDIRKKINCSNEYKVFLYLFLGKKNSVYLCSLNTVILPKQRQRRSSTVLYGQ